MAGKKQNINPTWKILMKEVDLDGHARKCVEQYASSRRDNHTMTDRLARKGQTSKCFDPAQVNLRDSSFDPTPSRVI